MIHPSRRLAAMWFVSCPTDRSSFGIWQAQRCPPGTWTRDRGGHPLRGGPETQSMPSPDRVDPLIVACRGPVPSPSHGRSPAPGRASSAGFGRAVYRSDRRTNPSARGHVPPLVVAGGHLGPGIDRREHPLPAPWPELRPSRPADGKPIGDAWSVRPVAASGGSWGGVRTDRATCRVGGTPWSSRSVRSGERPRGWPPKGDWRRDDPVAGVWAPRVFQGTMTRCVLPPRSVDRGHGRGLDLDLDPGLGHRCLRTSQAATPWSGRPVVAPGRFHRGRRRWDAQVGTRIGSSDRPALALVPTTRLGSRRVVRPDPRCRRPDLSVGLA